MFRSSPARLMVVCADASAKVAVALAHFRATAAAGDTLRSPHSTEALCGVSKDLSRPGPRRHDDAHPHADAAPPMRHGACLRGPRGPAGPRA